jgi:hypothetical protein
MPKQNVYLQSFNAGVVDAQGLARVDLEHMRLAAEDQTNFIPTITGAMFLRPGLGHINRTYLDATGSLKDFITGASSGVLLEFTAGKLSFYVNDQILVRNDVDTTVNQGDFSATGDWALTATDGATAQITSGTLRLKADAKGSKATAKQEVSVASGDRNVEHGLFINVDRGPITFRCGSTNGGDQYIAETELKEGFHSLAFTPTGASFWLFFQTASDTVKVVERCQIEAAGGVRLDTPWGTGEIPKLRFAQSADVMFVACQGNLPRRIERRGDRSWSIVKYLVDDGPFMLTRSAPVRLKPADLRGNTTLTADDNFFTESHVGALFRLFHDGQYINQAIAGEDQFTDTIRVTGVTDDDAGAGSDRRWTYTTTGTWDGTLRCYRSFDTETYGFRRFRKNESIDDDGDDPADFDITSNVTDQVQIDNDDNSIVFYRIGFSEYTSGAANIEIDYGGGGGYGICRVTGFNDKTSVDIEILRPFKSTKYTDDWLEGMWSDAQGHPSSVALSEGRLFWAGNDKFWGSVADAYESFDEETEGDSGPINRSIAIGGVNAVQWMLPLQRLEIGTNGLEVSVKSSSFDEPLSPTNLSLKSSSSVGSAPIAAVKVDGRGIFADRPARALFELIYSTEDNDYIASELTRLCRSWFNSGIVQLAVSRRPDTRVWAVLANGTCMCMVYEPAQKVVAFVPITTAGELESVAVLPGTAQDDVYFMVKRVINGSDHRSVEKMARDNQAVVGTRARVMDAYVDGTNDPPSDIITGATHLRNKQVKIWADGAPLTQTDPLTGLTTPKLFDVSSSGDIDLGGTVVTEFCYGLGYQGTYKSARLAYAAAGGTAMLRYKRINEIGLILNDYARSGIRYGRGFDNLWPLPALLDGVEPDDVSGDAVKEEHSITFDGEWHRDSRICITAEWPVNFLGLAFSIDTNG